MTSTKIVSADTPAVRTGDKRTMRHRVKCVLPACVLGALIVTALLSEYIFTTDSWFQRAVGQVAALGKDPATQWTVVLCLAFYATTFLFLERRRMEAGGKSGLTVLWLGMFLVLVLARYVFGYDTAINLTQVPVLLAGIVLGKSISAWTRGPKFRAGTLGFFVAEAARAVATKKAAIMFVLLALLAITAVWQPEMPSHFEYRGVSRWVGPWSNPNTFGLLMGVGVVLAIALGTRDWESGRGKLRKIFGTTPLIGVAGLCGFSLFRSYSRGAWIATLCGIIYLVWRAIQSPKSKVLDRGFPYVSWLRKNWIPLLTVAVSLLALSFWQFRFTEWRPARRIFSIANINDFSWRNRITAWHSAGRMMMGRPWFGYGWSQAESVYDEDFRPPQLENGGAIQMNDYFMIGISAGIPSLACLFIYIGSLLRSPRSVVRSPHSQSESGPEITALNTRLSTLQATCRAGAIVLAVGFWFDGGLFELSTGSVFWILLELARAGGSGSFGSCIQLERSSSNGPPAHGEPEAIANAPYQRARAEIWLRRVAWATASLALIETIVLIGTPFLPVNHTTLVVARTWLVPPQAVGDFDFLANTLRASRLQISEQPLKVLLQHANLANYNRELFDRKLDEEIYRDYVLWPDVYHSAANYSEPRTWNSALLLGDLNWRRELWEYFYPAIRHNTDLKAASQIVTKLLRQRLAIVPAGPLTVDEMWRQQKTDAKGFEAITVAAFRSVGIPARLSESGRAELFSDGKWERALDATTSGTPGH